MQTYLGSVSVNNRGWCWYTVDLAFKDRIAVARVKGLLSGGIILLGPMSAKGKC